MGAKKHQKQILLMLTTRPPNIQSCLEGARSKARVAQPGASWCSQINLFCSQTLLAAGTHRWLEDRRRGQSRCFSLSFFISFPSLASEFFPMASMAEQLWGIGLPPSRPLQGLGFGSTTSAFHPFLPGHYSTSFLEGNSITIQTCLSSFQMFHYSRHPLNWILMLNSLRMLPFSNEQWGIVSTHSILKIPAYP